jgi:hypothetical protein
MPRKVPSGTPDRSPDYIIPGDRDRPLWLAALAGLVVAIIVLAMYLVGQRRFASPGPVSQSHANIEVRCELCHTVSRGVADLRCERCHDPRGADRFTHPAHVLFGSGNSQKAMAAAPIGCATCHTDHRGRTVPVKSMDDRECGECHRFSSLKRHPEFAAVQAQIETGAGLNFGHAKHLQATVKRFGKRCEACHEPGSDRVAFQSMTFERHCATCHEHQENGVVPGDSEQVASDLIVMAADIAGGPAPSNRPGDLAGRVIFSGLKHRDPWVMYNAERLRRMIDPGGVNAEVVSLRLQSAYLKQQMNGQPLSQLDGPALASWRAILEQEVSSLDKRIGAAQATPDDAALRELREAVRNIGRQLAPAEPEAAALVDAAVQADAQLARSGSDQGETQQLFTARKAELTALLKAIADRGDEALADRAAALQRRVDQLQPLASGGSGDAAMLNARLQSLDEIFGALRATGDSQAIFAGGQVRALRDAARTQVNGGVSAEIFEDRRAELLGILDAVDRSADPSFASRAAVLRQRVLALQPGSYGIAGLRGLRTSKAKMLDRVKLEIALGGGQSSDARGSTGPSAISATADRELLQNQLVRTERRLAELQRIAPAGLADTPAEIAKASRSLSNLLTPCTLCHVLDGARIAPMRPAYTVFQRARFTHKPHVDSAKCESCHGAIETSQKATDVNEPGLARCQECHAPSKSRSDCAACHFYHPPSVARLFGAM